MTQLGAGKPSTDPPRPFQLLVSRRDGRYHAVWIGTILVAVANPWFQPPPAAVCGQLACAPRDPDAPMPEACDRCFHWLREKHPDAVCIDIEVPLRNVFDAHNRQYLRRPWRSWRWMRSSGESHAPEPIPTPLEFPIHQFKDDA